MKLRLTSLKLMIAILAAVFFSSSAFASDDHDPVESDVRDLVHFLKPGGDDCDSDGVEWHQNWSDRRKKFCPTLSKYRLGQTLSFEEGDPTHPCALFLGKKPIYKAANAKSKRQLSTYSTPDFQPKSHNEMLSEGRSLMTTAERKAIQERAKNDGGRLAKNCCGTNEKCLTAMQAVEIKFCDYPDAIRNPKSPNPCSRANGFYSRSESPRAAGNVLPGKITLSPYNVVVTDMTSLFAHEYGHACSDTWDQLNGMLVWDRTFHASAEALGNCTLNPKQTAHYKNATAATAGPELVDCLITLSSQQSPKSFGYIPESCDSRRLEEAFASAIMMVSLSEQGSAIPSLYPNACNYNPSKMHPFRGDVFKCVLSHSQKVRNQISAELSCPALSR